MGLTVAASVFQCIVSHTLAYINGCIVYLDDILVFAPTIQEHDVRLTQVLQKLQDTQFRLNPNKCFFAVSRIKFLGHIIATIVISPDPCSLDAICQAPTPTSIKDLRSFLGLVNYYRTYLPALASYAEPLQQLTNTANKTPFKWDTSADQAFANLKNLLSD